MSELREIQPGTPANADPATVASFGDEWEAYDQRNVDRDELTRIFDAYFSVFPFESLPKDAEGFDLGCGSGRWSLLMSDRVGLIHCIDASEKALSVARRNLAGRGNARFHLASVESIPLADNSQDFGFSLGVLHHVPEVRTAMASCVAKLKPGAPFLVYLYYSLDNRPGWFRALWRLSDGIRKLVSRLPLRPRKAISTTLAVLLYWPLALVSRALERLGFNVDSVPLSSYRELSFYIMRADALDRFGTPLEQRFSKEQIREMMASCGLSDIVFRECSPYWVACGRKAGGDRRRDADAAPDL